MNKPTIGTTTTEKGKIISIVCMDCGRKNDKKHKVAFGAWRGDCDICGKKGISVADAAHDFGIYSTKDIEARDKEQDKI